MLQPGGNIDAVPVHIIALHHYVAQIDTNAESHPFGFWESFILTGKLLLCLDGALHGLHDASELGDDRVAPGVDDAPIVALHQLRHGSAIAAQYVKGPRFVRFHQAGIPFDVGAQHRS